MAERNDEPRHEWRVEIHPGRIVKVAAGAERVSCLDEYIFPFRVAAKHEPDRNDDQQQRCRGTVGMVTHPGQGARKERSRIHSALLRRPRQFTRQGKRLKMCATARWCSMVLTFATRPTGVGWNLPKHLLN